MTREDIAVEATAVDARGDVAHEALRAWVAEDTKGWLWGQEREISPVLCDTVYGDGLKLFRLTTINSRPNYYVVRGDSSWAAELDPDAKTGTDFRDVLDQVLGDIEAQFGRALPEEAEFDDEDGAWLDEDGAPVEKAEWPALDDETGTAWDEIAWPDHVARDTPQAQESVMTDQKTHPDHPDYPYAGREGYGFTVHMQDSDSDGGFGPEVASCTFGEWCDANADGFPPEEFERIRREIEENGASIVAGFVGHGARLGKEPLEPTVAPRV
jgi:hypothetical protein